MTSRRGRNTKRKVNKPVASNKKVKVTPVDNGLKPHEKLHKALEESNLIQVQELINSGEKLCERKEHDRERKNCYMIAQENKNAEVLTYLLNNVKGITFKAVYENGNSLLMEDMKQHNYRHFDLLIEKGADVNHSNQKGCTALHYATILNAPIEIIKKLIEAKADVNAQAESEDYCEDDDPYFYWDGYNHVSRDEGEGDTPLIFLIKDSEEDADVFDKIKLLVESGANVNLSNCRNRTPLIIAAGLDYTKSSNMELIKYLINKGANAGARDGDHRTALDELLVRLFTDKKLSDKMKQKYVQDYHIPIINLFADATPINKTKDDTFGFHTWGKIVFKRLCDDIKKYANLQNNKGHMQDIMLHLIKLSYEKLPTHVDQFEHDHPLAAILQNLHTIITDKKFCEEITNIILYHPQANKFKHFGKHAKKIIKLGYSGWKCLGSNLEVKVSVFGAFVADMPLKDIKGWLMKLRQEKFDFVNEISLLTLLLGRVYLSEDSTTKNNLMEIVDSILQTDNPICCTELKFKNSTLNALQIILQIPDCIWISAVFGDIDLLKKLLPYWNQHPLAVLLLIRPKLEVDPKLQAFMFNSIKTILPYLVKTGGPLSHGTTLYNLMTKYLNEYPNKNELDDAEKDVMTMTVSKFKEVQQSKGDYNYDNIFKALYESRKSPASLKILCRTIIRTKAVDPGNNLPLYLASLVPDELKDFITLRGA